MMASRRLTKPMLVEAGRMAEQNEQHQESQQETTMCCFKTAPLALPSDGQLNAGLWWRHEQFRATGLPPDDAAALSS